MRSAFITSVERTYRVVDDGQCANRSTRNRAHIVSPIAAVRGPPDQPGDDGDGIVGLVPRQEREHVGPIHDARRLHPRHHQRGLAVLGHHQHRQALQRHRLVAGEVRQVSTDRDSSTSMSASCMRARARAMRSR